MTQGHRRPGAGIVTLLAALGTVFFAAGARLEAGGAVTVERVDKKLQVKIDGDLFTEYLPEGNRKPILYPVYGPGGVPMTRNYPMKDAPGEARDHVHQRSLWFTHGAVQLDGSPAVSFWHEGQNSGTTVHDTLLEHSGGTEGVIKTLNKWVGPDGKVRCTDIRTLTFRALADGSRALDYEVTLYASEGKLTLGDTKEGTMGIRTHSNLHLRNDPRQGVTTANGKALNSAGQRDGEIWGKRATWVDYWGTIDGKVVGIAIMDHPQNPRHPTWWHARDYGLVAANPFGVHDFEQKPAGTGDMVIEAGKSLTFRYGFVFHAGDAAAARIAEKYTDFASSTRQAD